MHGEKEISRYPRILLLLSILFSVLFSLFILFHHERIDIGLVVPGMKISFAHYVLSFYLVFYSLRLILSSLFILKRRVDFNEALIVSVWIFIIFASMVIGLRFYHFQNNLILTVSFLLYMTGSFLNSFSEIQRKSWKENEENRGKLYTQGLFSLSMHINYFGDVLLSTGMSLATGNFYTFLIPLLMTLMFLSMHIPQLDAYLQKKYPEQFQDYASKTKKFIPFIY